MADSTLERTSALARRFAADWSKTAVFSAGIAVGIVAGAPAAMTAIKQFWMNGAPRRSTERKHIRAPAPTQSEPYPYNCLDGGATIETPLGRTRYYDCGPRDGKKVLLIHGVSTPSNVWRHCVPILVEKGFRVLAFDLVGRGYSDGTDASGLAEDEIYINQISYLLTATDWSGSFSIVGFSMGGRLAAAFARYFYRRINRICLVAPAGLVTEEMLQPHLKMVMHGAMTHGRAKSFICGPQVVGKMPPSVRSMVTWQLDNHPAFADALTSSWLSGILLMSPSAPFNQLVSRFGNRMQCVWGDRDQVCPIESAKNVPGLKVHTIKGGDHFMVLDAQRQDEVVARILEVLNG